MAKKKADNTTVELCYRNPASGQTISTGPMPSEGWTESPQVQALAAAVLGAVKSKVKKTEVYLKYTFTKDELLDHARELGRSTHEIARIEGELDAIKKQLNAKIAEIEASRNVLSNYVTNGYDMRMVPCEVHFNVPLSKQKTIVRLDTGETVEVRAMDPYECQKELDFEKALDAKDAKTKDGQPENLAETESPAAQASSSDRKEIPVR